MFDFSNPAVFLSWLVFLPALVALVIAFLPAARRNDQVDLARRRRSSCSSCRLGMIFGWSDVAVPDRRSTPACSTCSPCDWIPSFGIQYLMGIDGISFPLVVLTAFISHAGDGARAGRSRST